MHGVKVNFGTLTQLALEDRPTAEISRFIEFCNGVGLPTTLAQLGLQRVTRDDLMKVAAAATMPSGTIHNLPFEGRCPDRLRRDDGGGRIRSGIS